EQGPLHDRRTSSLDHGPRTSPFRPPYPTLGTGSRCSPEQKDTKVNLRILAGNRGRSTRHSSAAGTCVPSSFCPILPVRTRRARPHPQIPHPSPRRPPAQAARSPGRPDGKAKRPRPATLRAEANRGFGPSYLPARLVAGDARGRADLAPASPLAAELAPRYLL